MYPPQFYNTYKNVSSVFCIHIKCAPKVNHFKNFAKKKNKIFPKKKNKNKRRENVEVMSLTYFKIRSYRHTFVWSHFIKSMFCNIENFFLFFFFLTNSKNENMELAGFDIHFHFQFQWIIHVQFSFDIHSLQICLWHNNFKVENKKENSNCYRSESYSHTYIYKSAPGSIGIRGGVNGNGKCSENLA